MLVEQDLPLDVAELIALGERTLAVASLGHARSCTASSSTASPACCANRATPRSRWTPCCRSVPQRLAEVPRRLAAVKAFAALPEAPALAAANKRVANILKKAQLGDEVPALDPARLIEPAEQALAQALAEVGPRADTAFEAGDHAASLQALAALKEPVDAFFDHVMVNADDPQLRANRLGLLAQLHLAMNRVADLSRLAV